MSTKLSLLPLNGGAFNCLPAREVELNDEKILCNNIVLPFSFNPHTVRLWVVGNEFGAICAIWADYEQGAFDEGIDAGLLDSLLVSEEDQKEADEETQEEWVRLGNADEPCDLTNVWIQAVRLSPEKDCELLCAFAYASGAGQKTLYS